MTKCSRAGGCAGSRYPFLISKERDVETGLDYFNARYYTSVQGRFTSVDPSGKSIFTGNPQSWNRYTYAYNQPLAFVDRNGKWPTSIHNLIIDRALPGLSKWERQQIKDGSWFVADPIQGGQHRANSNKHGMTKPGQTQEDAAFQADNYINNHVDMAQAHLARGFTAWSFLYPFKSTIVPSQNVLVITDDGRPVQNASVRQIWQHYSLESRSHEEDLRTGSNGRVTFPQRTVRASLLKRMVYPIWILLKDGIHASFGVRSDMFP